MCDGPVADKTAASILSGALVYYEISMVSEKRDRYRVYKSYCKGTQPVILFTEYGDPVAYLPPGPDVSRLPADPLLQAEF